MIPTKKPLYILRKATSTVNATVFNFGLQEKSEMVRLSVSTNSPVRTKDEDLGKPNNKSLRMRSKMVCFPSAHRFS